MNKNITAFIKRQIGLRPINPNEVPIKSITAENKLVAFYHVRSQHTQLTTSCVKALNSQYLSSPPKTLLVKHYIE